MPADLPDVLNVYYGHLTHVESLWQRTRSCFVLSVSLLEDYCTQLTTSFDLQAIVSEEDGMESIAHKFLSAAVKV